MVMTILTWIVFGLVVGFIARAIMPGNQSMGLVTTTILGVVGSFVGGFIGNLVSGHHVLDLNAAGFIGSVLGALLVLALMGFAGRRRTRLA